SLCAKAVALLFHLQVKIMFAAGLRSDPLRELKRSTDFIFGPQIYRKRLAAGLRPDPLGELQRSPRPPSCSGCGRFMAKPGKVITSRCFPRHWFHPQIVP